MLTAEAKRSCLLVFYMGLLPRNAGSYISQNACDQDLSLDTPMPIPVKTLTSSFKHSCADNIRFFKVKGIV